MTGFLIVAALMLVAALGFVLPPLLRKPQSAGVHVQRDILNLDVLRDQLRELDADREQGLIDDAGYDSAKKELERRVAEETRPEQQANPAAPTRKPWMAIAAAVMVPAIATGLYLLVGNPQGMDPSKLVADNQQQLTPDQVNAMVDKLARHLKEAPDDLRGWQLISRAYVSLGRFPEAADAYSHLVKLMPQDADVLVDYADALAMANNRSVQGEPEKLINQALEIDPKNVKALALSGGAAFERKDYPRAVTQWRKIMKLVPPTSEIARTVAASINEAFAQAGNMPMPAADATDDKPSKPTASSETSTAAQVSGTVDIDPSLRAQAKDSDTVFIFAKAVQGPPMPLAVLRKQVKDLPVTFTLDDSMSMMPSAKLSGFAQVVVGARVSKSGDPMPQVGDLEGLSGTVKPGAKGVKIVINTQHK
jgi:cytochrome c-type biogenesis protein CcmH